MDYFLDFFDFFLLFFFFSIEAIIILYRFSNSLAICSSVISECKDTTLSEK